MELEGHWEAVRRSVLGENMFPIDMGNDSALPDKDLIDASLSKVNEADAYIGMISYRYGQTPSCPRRNPEGLSLTELEYRRAAERGLPRCVFIMGKHHQGVSWEDAQAESSEAIEKRRMFTRRVRTDRVCADFNSVADLETKASKSLSKIRRILDKASGTNVSGASPSTRTQWAGALPPDLFAQPPYIPGYAFQGRIKEISAIDDWAGSADPVMMFEAIGGMGKSMVTWEWVTRAARSRDGHWAGMLWYSFYERGADMRGFCISALSYITRKAPSSFQTLSSRYLADILLPLLRLQPWLLVLDGLERVLVEYHRFDAAQLLDEEVGRSQHSSPRASNACLRPEDDELLQSLCAVSPSKVLMSSRLMPQSLLNQAGMPIPGVRRLQLTGLDPRDAELMLRDAGVFGSGDGMRDYLEQKFGCHPLVVGVVAGLVRKYMKAPGDFDRWVEDPQGGAAVNLADADIRQRQNHILKLAFDGLDPVRRELVTRIAIISNSVNWEIVEALNPALPPPPEKVNKPQGPVASDDPQQHRATPARNSDPPTEKRKAKKLLSEKEKQALATYRAAEEAHKRYEQEFAAWQISPEVRAAAAELSAALDDLEMRGLLQCDRSAGTFDLHPVVRGYAVQMLSPEVRAQSGQKVADYYSSRSRAPTADAGSAEDLADVVQVVRALSLAGKRDEAWKLLSYDLSDALQRLDLHYQYLELARAFFPDGWLAPPEPLSDGHSQLSIGVAFHLHNSGLRDEAAAQWQFGISGAIEQSDFLNLEQCLRGHAWTLANQGHVFKAEATMKLALEASKPYAVFADQIVEADYVRLLTYRGDFKRARARLSKLKPGNDEREIDQFRAKISLDHKSGRLRIGDVEAAIERARRAKIRWFERELWNVAGLIHLDQNEPAKALEAFGNAIEMARQARLSSEGSGTWRGVALARLGHRDEAARIAKSPGRHSEHLGMAQLHMALGNRDEAIRHALAAYREAWCDGPPYAHHWQLCRSRDTLAALGEPEPTLAEFDARRFDPHPYEGDVRRLVAEWRRKQRPRVEEAKRTGRP